MADMQASRGHAPIHSSLRGAALAVTVLTFLAGCGRSDMAEVSGRVTLDGQPLENAFLEFVPLGEKGSISSGRTDLAGEYELMFSRDTPGAFLGPHRVRITTREITVDKQQREVWLPERAPARYNAQSELEREVQPGVNRFDFDLKSDDAQR